MTDYQDVADKMDALLGLTTPPVAVAFVGAPPAGIAHTTKAAPSTCSFWRHAGQRVFYAAAPQHFNCEIGALVMGFDLPEHIMHNLGGVIEMMTGYSYLSPGEVVTDKKAWNVTKKRAHLDEEFNTEIFGTLEELVGHLGL